VVWFDCDFSHPPECIPQLLFMIGQGFDVVVNSRYVVGGGEDRAGKGGGLQLFLSRLLNWGVRFLLYPSFSDYTSGFVAVRREVFATMALRGDYGEYFVDFIFRVLRDGRYRVCELPYFATPRRSGESKTGSNLLQYLQRGRKYLATVLKLRFAGGA
jgi:dolichol-phosphate mannosyltransferase